MGRPSTVNETENLWSKQNNSEYLIALTTQTRAHTHTQKKKKKSNFLFSPPAALQQCGSISCHDYAGNR